MSTHRSSRAPRHSKPRLNSPLLLAIFAALPCWTATADPTTLELLWKGSGAPAPAGDNVNWSDPKNWTPGVVPKNIDDTLWFNATLPAGVSVTYDGAKTIPGPDILGQSQINNLTMANGSILNVTTTDLTVQSSLTTNGVAAIDNGRISAANGALVHIGATTYSSTGLIADFGGFNVNNWNLFTATGNGTLLDLSALQSLNAGYTPINDYNRQNINASNGAVINLSSVKTIATPTSSQDWLQFSVTDTAQINLSSLESVTTAGRGQLNFVVGGGATLLLPKLTTLNNVVFSLSGGAQVHLNGATPATYSSVTFIEDFGGFNVNNWNLFTATGNGTLLDLSALQSLNAGYTPINDYNRQNINASNGAVINLSSVKTIATPTSSQDWLQFSVTDTAQINLSSLESVTTAGRGQLNFVVGGGATLLLPKLTTLNNVVFSLSGGAQVHLNGATPATYSSVTFIEDFGGFNVNNWNLFTATGNGTLLDLSALQSLNAGYTPINDYNRQNINASNGAVINLSSVKTIATPTSSQDWLQFSVTDTAQINLSSLESVTTAGRGQLNFVVGGGATLLLPKLTTLNNVVFSLSGGTQVHLNGATPATYSSVTFIEDFGGFNVNNWNLFTATGNGTLLDLSALQSLNAGYTPINDYNRQNINVSDGATINLSGLTSLIVPASSQDWLQFTVTGPSPAQIDLSSLQRISSTGSGQLRISIDSGGKLTVGQLQTLALTQVALSGTGGQFNVLNSLWLRSAAVLNQDANTSVSVGKDLRIDTAATFTTAAKASVQVGGNLLFGTTDETKLALKPATITFNGGPAGPQICEAGGVDVSTATVALSNTNFAFGIMNVGTTGNATTLHLMDIANNANRSPNFEALYLNYDGADVNQNGTAGDEGLYVAAGSTLVLNGIHLYAWHNSTLTLVTPTASWSNGGGEIVQSITAAAGDVNFDGVLSGRDIDLEFQAATGQSKHPFFDFNANGVASSADVDAMLHNIFQSLYGDANLDHSVTFSDFLALQNNYNQPGGWSQGDFNGDSLVTFADFLVLQNNYNKSFPAGPILPATSSTSSGVPEPASLILISLGIATILSTRHRRTRPSP